MSVTKGNNERDNRIIGAYVEGNLFALLTTRLNINRLDKVGLIAWLDHEIEVIAGPDFKPPFTDATRTFVCQGCGRARVALHGRSIICGCGTKSAAELIKSPSEAGT